MYLDCKLNRINVLDTLDVNCKQFHVAICSCGPVLGFAFRGLQCVSGEYNPLMSTIKSGI